MTQEARRSKKRKGKKQEGEAGRKKREEARRRRSQMMKKPDEEEARGKKQKGRKRRKNFQSQGFAKERLIWSSIPSRTIVQASAADGSKSDLQLLPRYDHRSSR